MNIAIESETSLTPLERATARNSFVVDFEERFADWSTIAKVCIEVERDKDYLILGYHSWNAWLLAVAPKSRSYIYLVVGRYKELIPDIPEAELAQIPLGSAGVLKQLSSAARRDPAVRQAARSKPSELRMMVGAAHPDQAMEMTVERRCRFTMSQWNVIDGAYQAYQMIDEGASFEDFLEFLVSEQSQ